MSAIIQKLFGRRRTAYQEIPTVPLGKREDEELEVPEKDQIHLELSQFIVGCSTSIGRQRDHNEDSLFALTTNLACDKGQISLGLYIVADGMGGHKNGEVASEMAIRSISSYITRKVVNSRYNPKPTSPNESIQEIMQDSALEAHRVIAKNAPGGGTTMTALLLMDQQMTIAHIGDSRAYSIAPDGTLKVLTRDHSLVMRMMELGQLTPAEALVHPQRNVLYRALGQGEPSSPDISTNPIPSSGHLLLCSDGLWGVLDEEDIIRLVNNNHDPQTSSQNLIDAANEAGGPDNITAILVRLPD